MTSEDKNRDNMNDRNRDAFLENEANSDELLAIGNDPQKKSDGASDSEENLATSDEKSRSCERRREGSELCSCSSRNQLRFTLNRAPAIWCMLCGRVINRNSTHQRKLNISVPKPAGMEGSLFSVVTQSSTEYLPLLPSTSLEDEACSSSHQAASLVTGRSQLQKEKIPVLNVCENSVQCPSPGITVRMFLFERTHRERNEKWFILYMIPENECKVYEAICERYIEEGTDQGYTTRQIQFSVNNARGQDFHTAYVHEQIKISFEIENQWQENFVPQDGRREFVFRVANIQCESNNRVAPGAKSHFRLQYVGEPENLCQEQGKITLTIDSTTQCTLFFSIAFWSSMAAVD